MAFSDKVCEETSEEALKLGHRLVNAVAKDIDSLQFNTAIAKMMEFMNDFTKLSKYPRVVVKMATQALAPFAPHIAEEIWEHLCPGDSIVYQDFPVADEKYLQDAVVTYVVQVNGKLRGRFDLPKDESEAVVLEAAKKNAHIMAFLEGREIQKIIFVPNRLLNIVLI
jgi:leucyl-tRNA synthetase